MNKFDYTIDVEVALMEKYGVSPNELFIVKTILLAQEGYSENYLYRFLQIPEKNRGDVREIILSLQNKGIILKTYKIPKKGEAFDPVEIPINKAFFKNVYRSAFDMGKELFDAYPMFTTINGGMVSLRGIAKKFDSLEDFFRYYGKTINWNPELHKDILDLIQWEKDNNVGYINFSISTFVIEHKWEELKTLKEGKLNNINFDTFKSL